MKEGNLPITRSLVIGFLVSNSTGLNLREPNGLEQTLWTRR